MIHLTLTLPATATELSDYAALAAEIDPDLTIEVDTMGAGFQLVAAIGRPEPVAVPEPTPASAKAPKANKRAGRKGPAKTKGARRRAFQPGTAAHGILAHLAANGPFDGGTTALCRAAWPQSPSSAANHIIPLERDGLIVVERQGRTAVRIDITDKGCQRLHGPTERPQRPDLRPVPTPTEEAKAKADHPAARPALPAPAGGIKPPSGGWA